MELSVYKVKYYRSETKQTERQNEERKSQFQPACCFSTTDSSVSFSSETVFKFSLMVLLHNNTLTYKTALAEMKKKIKKSKTRHKQKNKQTRFLSLKCLCVLHVCCVFSHRKPEPPRIIKKAAVWSFCPWKEMFILNVKWAAEKQTWFRSCLHDIQCVHWIITAGGCWAGGRLRWPRSPAAEPWTRSALREKNKTLTHRWWRKGTSRVFLSL